MTELGTVTVELVNYNNMCDWNFKNPSRIGKKLKSNSQLNSYTLALSRHTKHMAIAYRWPSVLSQMAFCSPCQTMKVYYIQLLETHIECIDCKLYTPDEDNGTFPMFLHKRILTQHLSFTKTKVTMFHYPVLTQLHPLHLINQFLLRLVNHRVLVDGQLKFLSNVQINYCMCSPVCSFHQIFSEWYTSRRLENWLHNVYLQVG